MDKKKFLYWIILLFLGLQLAGCATPDYDYVGNRESPLDRTRLDQDRR
jgi:hypothetical protein